MDEIAIIVEQIVDQVAIAVSESVEVVDIHSSETVEQVNISILEGAPEAVTIVAESIIEEVVIHAEESGAFINLVNERLTGVVDGLNRNFFTSSVFIPASLAVFINGLKETEFSVLSSTEILLDQAPRNFGFTDTVEAMYMKI